MGIARSTFYETPTAELDGTALLAAICAEFEAYGWAESAPQSASKACSPTTSGSGG